MGRTPSRGFTLVELLVVILIISILMALLIPVLLHVLAVVRHGVAEDLASQVVTSLKAYELDHGVYPGGDGNGSPAMVKALTEPGPRKMPLLELKDEMVTAEGDLINPAQHDADAPLGIFHYRNNHGRKPGPDPSGGPGVSSRNEYDLWCAGSDYDPKRPLSAFSIHRP
jgi:prepilin-type N-terminal cleavage/methylation domain-containing protein